MEPILLITLENESCAELQAKLNSTDILVHSTSSYNEALSQLNSCSYSSCIIRYNQNFEAALSISDFILKQKLNIKILVSTINGSISDAVRLMKAGATDYIIGDLTDPRLIESVVKLTSSKESFLFADGSEEQQIILSDNNINLIGKSAAISEIRSAIRLVAKSETTVLISGESGTGKEVVANLIHRHSKRAEKQFHALNCATLPKDVIENELFGHEKGAFTGALQKKAGCFEMANGGTLLLDEIAEMSLETQAKLLRVIETQKFRRLGGKEEINVDVRMVAATNKNISEAIKSKELREDLYYRLSVIEIYIPPLRERKEDVPLLVDYFLKIFAAKYDKPTQRFSEDAIELMMLYHWPGNIRELRNIVERAIVICNHQIINTHYLPQRLLLQPTLQTSISIPIGCTAHEAERILFLQTLVSTGNNKAKAAKILGISRKTLHNKLSSYQLE
ncbi:MAG: sigma-54-dependent Fis family transcriptional regulator [Ignavibacteriales bacterium]|nr:sigma-54-dependent Fis family transcriptional regulator [Ignavibacteriales bacterium]